MPTYRTLVQILAEPRAAAAAVTGAALTALVIATPTSVLPSPFFTRMTPTRPQDIAFLWITAALAGLLVATYVRPAAGGAPAVDRQAGSGGLLAFLAIGCPICNKVVVALLGVSGALAWFEPVQPLLGALGVVLLAWALVIRVRTLAACAVPPAARPASSTAA